MVVDDVHLGSGLSIAAATVFGNVCEKYSKWRENVNVFGVFCGGGVVRGLLVPDWR